MNQSVIDEHGEVAKLLGAYVDGELPDTDIRRVEAHLAHCETCRREVVLQTAVRTHLNAESPAAPPALRERIRLATYGAAAEERERVTPSASAPPVPRSSAAPPTWRRVVPWAGWALAAILAALLLFRSEPQGSDLPSAPRVVLDSARVPMVEDALADYRRRIATDLSLNAGDLAQVSDQIPFPITPLRSPDARLIGAWTTEILDKPAAVLAYRWGDRVIVQYVVSEALFFAPAEVREAVASEGRYAVSVGRQGVIAWPRAQSGSILIGDLPPSELAELRS